jgi:putative transposase
MSGHKGNTRPAIAARLREMPWTETNPVNERRRFIQDYESKAWNMTELCERYGISRKAGYALLARFEAEGDAVHSRFLLRVTALPNVRTEGAKPVFERLFRAVGLPLAIRSDNGAPFASTGIHGLCELNTWWMRLGITHQRIQPSSPQQNGAHERMHRTLKRETARPPARNHAGQQRRFDTFRKRYNFERPHEALDDETPGSIWTPSPRPFPNKIAPPEYPGHCEVRLVSNAGCFRLSAGQIFLSQALNGEYIALEEVDDGLWNIVYYNTLLGRFDQSTKWISGADFRTEPR